MVLVYTRNVGTERQESGHQVIIYYFFVSVTPGGQTQTYSLYVMNEFELFVSTCCSFEFRVCARNVASECRCTMGAWSGDSNSYRKMKGSYCADGM